MVGTKVSNLFRYNGVGIPERVIRPFAHMPMSNLRRGRSWLHWIGTRGNSHSTILRSVMICLGTHEIPAVKTQSTISTNTTHRGLVIC